MQYFYAQDNQQRGPCSLDELIGLNLRGDTLVWREGLTDWQRADSVPEWIQGVSAKSAVQSPAPVVSNTEVIEPAPSPSAVAAPAAIGNQPISPVQRPLSYQSAHALEAQPSGLAIASMILGIVCILSFCGFHIGAIAGLPCAILALVFGFIAKGKATRREAGGRGMALTGIILGSVYLGLWALIILAAIGIGIFMALSH